MLYTTNAFWGGGLLFDTRGVKAQLPRTLYKKIYGELLVHLTFGIAKFILEEAPVTLVIGYCCDFVTNSELPLIMQGPESEELASASKLEDDVNFYQTVNPDVAKIFHVDPEAKRPALVLLKKEAEKLSYFG